jgi:hypothetical protein
VATDLNAKYELLRNESSDVCLGHDAINGASVDFKVINQPNHVLFAHVSVFSCTCYPIKLPYDDYCESFMKYLRFSCKTSQNILQSCHEEPAHPIMETIFSPSFHIAKHAGGEIANGG